MYHSIELPHNIPKSSFERDLDFYGLVPEEGEIKNNSIADVLVSLRTAKSKHDMFLFALEVNHRYILKRKENSSKQEIMICGDEICENDDLGKNRYHLLSQAEEALFMSTSA